MGVFLKGLDLIKEWAEDKAKIQEKAVYGALAETSYETAKNIKLQLKAGTLGLTPLSDIRKALGLRKRNPLQILNLGIRYSVDKKNLVSYMGFIRKGSKRPIMVDWAETAAPGYIWRYTPGEIEVLHRQGVHVSKAKQQSGVMVPARNPIDQFSSANRQVILEMFKMKYFDKVKKG